MDPINGQAPVAFIQIALMQDGRLHIASQVPNRYTLNGMLETAKQNLVAQVLADEQQVGKVVVPPPMPGINLRG